MTESPLLIRIRESSDRLTRAEQRLVQEILANPEQIALGTAAKLAERAGVHEATASRLARKLGFQAYVAFRDALRAEFIANAEPAKRMQKSLDDARGGALLADLVGQEIEALTRLPEIVSEARIAAAAAMLADARRVFVFAKGNAVTLAVMMDRRLRRFGLETTLLLGDGRELAERALALTPDDAVLAFAFRQRPSGYRPLLELARQRRAKTILVSGTIGPTLTPAPDLLLSAPRGGSRDAFQTLAVPMTICNAVVLAIARRDEARSLHRLDDLGALIDRFEHG